jgi:hypothetical protein
MTTSRCTHVCTHRTHQSFLSPYRKNSLRPARHDSEGVTQSSSAWQQALSLSGLDGWRGRGGAQGGRPRRRWGPAPRIEHRRAADAEEEGGGRGASTGRDGWCCHPQLVVALLSAARLQLLAAGGNRENKEGEE